MKAWERREKLSPPPFPLPAPPMPSSEMAVLPVFCDIEEDFYTIDVKKLRSLISKDTVAILPVHVYGHICAVEELDKISKEFDIPVLYDAAHAFGERYHGRGVGSFGYASMFSFHATKVFHSIEGGAVCIGEKNPELLHKLYALKNFGIMGQESVELVGCNGKMNGIFPLPWDFAIYGISRIISRKERSDTGITKAC